MEKNECKRLPRMLRSISHVASPCEFVREKPYFPVCTRRAFLNVILTFSSLTTISTSFGPTGWPLRVNLATALDVLVPMTERRL